MLYIYIFKDGSHNILILNTYLNNIISSQKENVSYAKKNEHYFLKVNV